MNEAEEIEELITAYRMEVGDWATSLEETCFDRMDKTEQALRDKIQSIITERDQLRAALADIISEIEKMKTEGNQLIAELMKGLQ